MKVFLTFDVEIWCGAWTDLDARFPASYRRYIYGESAYGQYALPKTLEILKQFNLHGTFFVEPLFAARFGRQYLDTIVKMIRNDGHEIQLHLHPEWTDEIAPPLIRNSTKKRQHLSYYTKDEQARLIRAGLGLLKDAGANPISAFRAGSFAANRDTFSALEENDIIYDSSLNRSIPISCPDIGAQRENPAPFHLGNIQEYPMTVFVDGLGKLRHAQVGACSAAEMRDALVAAHSAGYENFVILSHNFEMLKPASSEPDSIVVKRFLRLCEFLNKHDDKFAVTGFKRERSENETDGRGNQQPEITVNKASTFVRLFEQGRRRLNLA